MIRGPHLQLIAGHSVRHGVRGGAGLISLLLTLLLGLILASVVISPLEDAERAQRTAAEHPTDVEAQRRAPSPEAIREITSKAIDWVMSPSPEDSAFLTVSRPSTVSAILVLLMLVTPLLACMGGFNQTSGDVASKGLRFLLIRTERSNIFFGRFLGTYLFSAVVFATLFVILGLYMSIKVHVHGTGEMLGWLASGYLRVMLFELPYIALCAAISAAIDSTFGSLVICLLVAYLLPLFFYIGSRTQDAISYAQYATPWGYKWMLLAPVGGELLLGVAVMLAFTALFLFVGHRQFSRRDL